MKEQIKFEDFEKLKMKVGTIKSIDDKIKISLDGMEYKINAMFDVSKGDQIVVGLVEGGLVIPLVNGDIFLKPEEKVKGGSGVS